MLNSISSYTTRCTNRPITHQQVLAQINGKLPFENLKILKVSKVTQHGSYMLSCFSQLGQLSELYLAHITCYSSNMLGGMIWTRAIMLLRQNNKLRPVKFRLKCLHYSKTEDLTCSRLENKKTFLGPDEYQSHVRDICRFVRSDSDSEGPWTKALEQHFGCTPSEASGTHVERSLMDGNENTANFLVLRPT